MVSAQLFSALLLPGKFSSDANFALFCPCIFFQIDLNTFSVLLLSTKLTVFLSEMCTPP